MTNHLTHEQLERYAQRSLSVEELLEADDHIAHCERCRAVLAGSNAIARIYSALQRSIEAGTAHTPFKFTGSDGVVLIDGEMQKRGAEIASGLTIVCLGKASFALDNVRIETDDTRTQFKAQYGESSGEWRFTPAVGHLRFVDSANPARYAVALGERIIRPMGTRFEARAGASGRERVAVYNDSVEVRFGEGRSVINSGVGTDFVHGNAGITEDPTALMGIRAILGPVSHGSGVGRIRRKKNHSLSLGMLEYLTAVEQAACKSETDPLPYVKIALDMVGACERPAAADAMQQAFDRDALLLNTRDDDLWNLLRAMAAKDGDLGIAGRVLGLLDVRQSRSRDLRIGFKCWIDAMNSRQPDWNGALTAARRIEQLGNQDDALFVVEALVQAGTERPAYDLAALRQAAKLAREYISGSIDQTGSRLLAMAWQRLGEALFYLGDRNESLEATRNAVEIWPRARWKVHLATRMCEIQEVDREVVLALLQDGIAEDPSYYTYQRMWVAMVRLAASDQDWQHVDRLMAWIADTYCSVQSANTAAAGHFLATGDSQRADLYMQRALDLPAGSELFSQRERNVAGLLLWRRGQQNAALSAVRYDDGRAEDQQAWEFFESIGDYKSALQVIQDPALESGIEDNNRWNRLLIEAGLLVKLGRLDEAAATYKRQLDFLEHEACNNAMISPNTLVETRLCLGELVLTRDPDYAKALARAALAEIPTIHGGSMNRVGHQLSWSARAHWLTGEHDQAINEIERCLSLSPHVELRKAAEKFLDRWRLDRAAPGPQ